MVFKSIAMAVIAACLLVPTASAFDYSGLRSGMSFAEVSAAAERAGLQPLEPAKNVPGLYTLGPPHLSTVNMTFCADRLFALTSAPQGGVDAFAQLTKEMVAGYGNPVVQPISSYTETGLLSTVRMEWAVEGGETVALDITSYGGKITVARMYSAFDVLCPKP